MRNRSPKMAAIYKAHAGMRRELIRWAEGCYHCGATDGLACHEMLNGPNRMRAFGRVECLLVLCPRCNCDLFTNKRDFPLERQLAIKLLKDPANFDPRVIREVAAPEGCPNPPGLFYESDILRWIKHELTN